MLWLSDPSVELPSAVVRALRRTPVGQRYVSAISALEIGIKCAKGQLHLSLPPQAWLDASYAQRGLTSLPITDRIATRSAALPKLHKDPADRLIVASAIIHRLTILTPDEAIAAYPGVKVLWKS